MIEGEDCETGESCVFVSLAESVVLRTEVTRSLKVSDLRNSSASVFFMLLANMEVIVTIELVASATVLFMLIFIIIRFLSKFLNQTHFLPLNMGSFKMVIF